MKKPINIALKKGIQKLTKTERDAYDAELAGNKQKYGEKLDEFVDIRSKIPKGEGLSANKKRKFETSKNRFLTTYNRKFELEQKDR
jgi:hypothetical protein